jgi:hypothetical protein
MDQPTSLQPDSPCHDIDFMELVILVFHRIHWVLAFAIAASALAYLIARVLPATYQSVSVLSAEKSVAADEAPLGPSAHQVAAMAKSTDLALQFYQSEPKLRSLDQQRALEMVRDRIQVTVGRQDKLVSLTTKGSTPEDALALNNFILEKLFELSKPRGPQLDILNKSIQPLNDTLANSVLIRDLMTKAASNGKQISDSQAAIYADMMRSIPDLSQRLTQFETIKMGLTASDLVQRPTLATRPSSPSVPRLVLGTALASALLGVLWVVSQYYWRNSGRAEYARRLKAIKLKTNS